jgi:hypothetical protein
MEPHIIKRMGQDEHSNWSASHFAETNPDPSSGPPPDTPFPLFGARIFPPDVDPMQALSEYQAASMSTQPDYIIHSTHRAQLSNDS